MDERAYWLGFSVFPGIGPGKFGLLFNHFGSAKTAWEASLIDLKEILGEKLAMQLDQFRSTFSIENYLDKLAQKEVWFVTLGDEYYPSLLKQIKHPPFVLYGKGENFMSSPQSNDDKFIAIVGTRRITEYGREVTRMLAGDLARAGMKIVSGLAIGVDAASHQAALENQGKTIAVLGSGVDYCSPEENLSLYNQLIAGNGCIVSEYPLGQKPSKGSFPARNRIIAGLSVGVIVTEGAEDSGALYTASAAFETNRAVFAVPGQITSQLAKGPLRLLQQGAKLIISAEDVLQELGLQAKSRGQSADGAELRAKSKMIGDTLEEQKILDILQNESWHFDDLVKQSGLDSALVGSTLSILEIKGIIKNLGNAVYTLAL